MTSGNKLKSFLKSLYIMAFAAPFLLTACAGSIEPGPMPSGYKYHNGVYKAPRGAEPGFWERGPAEKNAQSTELAPIGSLTGSPTSGRQNYGENDAMSAEMMAWLPASRELITRIKARLGYPVEPTFFEGMNGQSIPGFEMALKAATSEQGWPTAPSRGEGPFHLAYSAEPSDSSNSGRLMLKIRLTVSANNFVIEESGVYAIGTSIGMNDVTGGPAVMAAPVDQVFPVTVE